LEALVPYLRTGEMIDEIDAATAERLPQIQPLVELRQGIPREYVVMDRLRVVPRARDRQRGRALQDAAQQRRRRLGPLAANHEPRLRDVAVRGDEAEVEDGERGGNHHRKEKEPVDALQAAGESDCHRMVLVRIASVSRNRTISFSRET